MARIAESDWIWGINRDILRMIGVRVQRKLIGEVGRTELKYGQNGGRQPWGREAANAGVLEVRTPPRAPHVHLLLHAHLLLHT